MMKLTQLPQLLLTQQHQVANDAVTQLAANDAAAAASPAAGPKIEDTFFNNNIILQAAKQRLRPPQYS